MSTEETPDGWVFYTQASRLIHQYGRDGALKAVKKNVKKAVSEAQEDFWIAVGDLIEETCTRTSEELA